MFNQPIGIVSAIIMTHPEAGNDTQILGPKTEMYDAPG